MDDCLLSSDKMDYQTPESELAYVRRVGEIFLDPATADSNPTGAAVYCSAGHHSPHLRNGLLAPWGALLRCAPTAVDNPLVFLNPPYGRALEPWKDKVLQEAQRGAQIVTLTPSRTDTNWWQDLAAGASAGLFLRGRITFIDAATGKPVVCWDKKAKKWKPSPAAFPVFIGYFGQHKDRFRAAYAGRGRLL